jgi:hypothetical protein
MAYIRHQVLGEVASAQVCAAVQVGVRFLWQGETRVVLWSNTRNLCSSGWPCILQAVTKNSSISTVLVCHQTSLDHHRRLDPAFLTSSSWKSGCSRTSARSFLISACGFLFLWASQWIEAAAQEGR